MEKFSRVLRGYDPDEVNAFLDQIIRQVEVMVDEIKSKDAKIASLKSQLNGQNEEIANVDHLKEKLAQYERIEGTLNRAIIMAQKTSDQIKSTAHRESEILIEDAKKNASRIVNEALLKAEKTEAETAMLRRNINTFKRKLKDIIESQLEIVEDIEKVEI